MNNRKLITTLLIIITLIIPILPFTVQSNNELVDQIAGEIFSEIFKVTLLQQAFQIFTLSGETLEKAYTDLDKLWLDALKEWRFHNKYVVKYEAEVAMAQSEYDSKSTALTNAHKRYREHVDFCYYGGNCYDGTMYLKDIETAQKELDKAKTALKGAKSLLSYSTRLRENQSEIMDIYDEGRAGLIEELEPYREEKAKRIAEIKKIVIEVLGDIPQTVTELQSKIEELENKVDEQGKKIDEQGKKIDEQAKDIESLKNAIQALQDFQNSNQSESE